MDDFGRTYAELSEEERRIVDERMKKMRKQEEELDLDELENVNAGVKATFSDVTDPDELNLNELENVVAGVPSDLGEEQFKKI